MVSLRSGSLGAIVALSFLLGSASAQSCCDDCSCSNPGSCKKCAGECQWNQGSRACEADDSPPPPAPGPPPGPAPSTPAPAPTCNDVQGWQITLATSGVVNVGLYEDAKTRWEQVVTDDMPKVLGSDLSPSGDTMWCGSRPECIDDLFMCAREQYIDGDGDILGWAAVGWYWTASGLPITGELVLDADDMATGNFDSVIRHEMGHLVGVGGAPKWDELVNAPKNWRKCREGYPYLYSGTEATYVWRVDYGCAGTPPIESSTGSCGSDGGHWDFDCLSNDVYGTNELMTGFTCGDKDPCPTSNPLSKLTIASLADLGYTVSYDTAEDMVPNPTCCNPTRRTARNLGKEEKKGLFGTGPPPHAQASEKARANAIAYGKQILAKQHTKAPSPSSNKGIDYMADKHVHVFFLEGGAIHSVTVNADT